MQQQHCHLPDRCGALQDKFAAIHVYVLENIANGQCYVGQATDLATHFAQHKTKPTTGWPQMQHYTCLVSDVSACLSLALSLVSMLLLLRSC